MSSAPGAALAFDPARQEEHLLERCGLLRERALADGADEAEVYATRGEAIVARFENADLRLTTVDEGSALGLRVFQAGRLGFASTNQTGDAALAQVAADALTLARISPPDDANGLPPAPERRAAGAASLVRPAIAALSVEEIVAQANDLVGRAVSIDPRLSVDKAEVSLARTTRAVSTSAGIEVAQSDARLSSSLFGMAVDGDEVGGFQYWGACLRELAELDASLDEVARHFADAALGNLGAARGESYRGPVLLAPDALLDMLVAPICSAASAIAVQRGRSALAGKRGEPVASPLLSLSDDPTDAGLAGARAFDREGIPTRPFPLVADGILGGYLYNGYAARVEGQASTGHAQGGTRGAPGLGPHALCVAPDPAGAPDRAGMARALGRGLLVQRFSGTVDPTSGDLSGVAKSARWVEHGEVVRSVKETLLSGNAFELLGSLVRLSSKTTNVMGSARAPWAIVDGFSVTAG